MTPELFVAILICIVAVIFGQPLLALLADYGIPLLQAARRRYLRIEWHGVMSRIADDDQSLESNDDPAFSPATTTPATSNNGLQSDATSSNSLLLGQARALAAMVKAGKIGETEGIKLVFGVSPSSTNARYIAARAALKAELERLTDHFPNMSPEQKRAREVLGIAKP